MDLKLEELTEELISMKEKELLGIAEAISTPLSPPKDLKESVIKQAKLDTVLKDSTDFVADAFGKGFLGVVDTVVCLGTNRTPKRTF